MISRDKDDALAHERLGDVLFDLKEAEAMIERPGLTENMKDDIRFLIEDAEVDFKNLRKVGRIWLSKKNKKEREFGERWAQVRDRTGKTQSDEAARASDPFYSTAENLGKRLAKTLDSLADGETTSLLAPRISATAGPAGGGRSEAASLSARTNPYS